MPRLKAPAVGRQSIADATPNTPYIRHGQRALEHLAAHGPTDSRELMAAMGVRSDLNKYIAREIMDGRIVSRPNPRGGPGGYLVRAYMLAEQAPAWDAAHGTAPTPAVTDATPAVGRQSIADAPTAPAVGRQFLADAPTAPRFALWDDGEISITAGDDIIRLDRPAVRRLIGLLRIADTALDAAA